MSNEVSNLEKTPFIEDIVDDLINKEQGKVALATGTPGSGKSLSMARIEELIDPDFSLDKIAIGKTTELLKLLRMALDGKLKHGTAIMLDETGIGIPARDWNNAQNRIFSLIFQAIRKLGLFIGLTAPAKRMIDIHAMLMVKYYCKAHYIDYKKKRSNFSLYLIDYDDWNDILKRRLLIDANGEKVHRWELALPNRSIELKEYEKKKDEMIGHLLDRAEVIFAELENDNEGKEFFEKKKKSATKYAEEKIIEGYGMGHVDYLAISEETGIAIKSLTSVESALRKTGAIE